MAEIVIVNPRFEVSFWGAEHALPLLGKKANLPVASLPLLAALTPQPHRVTLIDENVEPLDFDCLARADIVGLTGMSVQRFRMQEILQELKQRGVFTVVGGPWVSVEERYFGDLGRRDLCRRGGRDVAGVPARLAETLAPHTLRAVGAHGHDEGPLSALRSDTSA